MPRLPLRPALPSDAPAITALTRAAYAKWVPLIGREPRPMTVDYAAAIREHEFALYEQDGRLLGVIEFAERFGYILIVNVAVSPEAQGDGIGSALLDHVERLAAERGDSEIRLYTNNRMQWNLRLYRSRGYVEFGRDPMPDETDVVHLKKVVAAVGSRQ